MLFVGPFKLAMQIPSWDRFLQQFSAISCTPRMKIFWFSIFSFVDIKILFFFFSPTSFSCTHTPQAQCTCGKIFPCTSATPESAGDFVYFLLCLVCPVTIKSRWNFYPITEHVCESRCVFIQERVVGLWVQSLPFACDTQLAFQMISLS